MQVFRIPQKCGWTKVILITLPKTNSSHLSGVSWPQKQTHPSNPTSQFFCSKAVFFHQAATKGGTRMMFGQEMKVKPQPAKTVVKAFPASQLKSQIWGHA